MNHDEKSREQLLQELAAAQQKIAALEQAKSRKERQMEAWRRLWSDCESFIEAIDGLIFVCSQDYEVEFMNQRFISRLGSYPLGRKCYKVLHDLDEPCPWCVNSRVFQGEQVSCDIFSDQDQRWYYVVNSPVYHAGGTVSKLGMMLDVTAYKQKEDALKKNEAMYRELAEKANSIILRADPNGRVTFFNKFAQDFFGYRAEEIIGRPLLGTIIPETDREGRDLTAMVAEIGRHPDRFASNENENIKRNGERVRLSWTNRPLTDEKGKVREILSVGDPSPAPRRDRAATRKRCSR